jgi:glucokinase
MARLIPELPPYFMGITWSSGIGLRIFKEGYILADSEGGHTPLDPSPYAPLCGCGVRGCAESILSGRAIIHRVKAETEALGIPVPEGLHPCKFLDQCFDNGEQWAIDIYDLITSGMGAFLANIQMIFHLPAIVWKGTFAECAFKRRGIERSIREKMRRKLINPTWEEEMKFFFSPKPKHDALIGAASMMSEGLSRAS